MIAIFRDFRRLVEAVELLVDVFRKRLDADRPTIERLDSLELSRFHFEAQCESLLLKAEGKLKAASNAEARERQLKKSYEKLADEIDPDSQLEPEARRIVLANDVEAGEAERLQAVRLDVAPNKKAHALRAKWS